MRLIIHDLTLILSIFKNFQFTVFYENSRACQNVSRIFMNEHPQRLFIFKALRCEA